MGLLNYINKGVTLAATAALSSGVTYWLCSESNEQTVSELRDRVVELQKQVQTAMVTKRISEQMEDIAFQQKNISDKERERAERQSQIADIERGRAIIERGLARQAEAQALQSAQQADSMRKLAEYQALIATQEQQFALEARAKVDTLYYTSLGKLLAQNSIAQGSAGATELASLLSFASWHYTRTYGADVYQQDVFTSLLRTAEQSMQSIGSISGNVRAMQPVGDDLVAVSDYGQIALLKAVKDGRKGAEKYKVRQLFADNNYVFHDVKTDGATTCYALDITGKLIVLDFNDPSASPQPLVLPYGTWHRLLRQSDGTLIALADDCIAWIAKDGRHVLRSEEVKDGLIEAGLMNDHLVLCYATRRMGILDGYNEVRSLDNVIPRQVGLTAFRYLADYGWFVVGTETGAVYVYDENGKLLNTLHGHSGRVTQIENMGWMLVTSSYDQTVRLWDIRDITSLMTPVNISYDRWPLCFAINEKQQTLSIGMEGGDIQRVTVSPKKNAESTHSNITREFTNDEWRYYIGKDVPYKTFKNYKP